MYYFNKTLTFICNNIYLQINKKVISLRQIKKTMLRIKEVAKQKGVPINELADKIGISRITLHNQMNGNPTVETLQKIAEALGVEVSELFEKKTDNSTQTCPHCGKPITIHIQ